MSKTKSSTKPSIIKRRPNSAVGIFVDGVGLDRACKRIKRRVDWKKLLSSLGAGKRLVEARYYNLLPNTDDNRQTAFLDALGQAGFESVIKRLPPKHIEKQVSIAVEMASDLMAFALGQNEFPDLHYFAVRSAAKRNPTAADWDEEAKPLVAKLTPEESKILSQREVILVCPSKELEYTVSYLKLLGVKTSTADFGTFSVNKTLTASDGWIDLSLSESIWHGSEAARVST